jgi:hypothetical protein
MTVQQDDPMASVAQAQIRENGRPEDRASTRETEPEIGEPEAKTPAPEPEGGETETGETEEKAPAVTVSDEERDAWLAFKSERAKQAVLAAQKPAEPSAPPAAPPAAPAVPAPPAAPAAETAAPLAPFALPSIDDADLSAAYLDLDTGRIAELRKRDSEAITSYVNGMREHFTQQIDGFRERMVEAGADTALGMALAVDVLKQVPEVENNVWMAAQAVQEAYQKTPKASLLQIQKDAVEILRKDMAVAAKMEKSAKQQPQTAPRTATPGSRSETASRERETVSYVGKSSEERRLGL